MIESSRLFLFTEYARKGCGTIETHGTDYKVWDALPVYFRSLYSYVSLLTLCRIVSLPTRELRSFWLESRTTKSPRRRGSRLTTLVASHTAQTPAPQRVCTPKSWANTCAMTLSPMERTDTKHRFPYIACCHSHASVFFCSASSKTACTSYSFYIQYYAINTFSTPVMAARNVCAFTS
jgi:hypothetical protein